ncbi:MAG: hypothetical protein ACI91T_002067, partial [Natronomonas sp.]
MIPTTLYPSGSSAGVRSTVPVTGPGVSIGRP